MKKSIFILTLALLSIPRIGYSSANSPVEVSKTDTTQVVTYKYAQICPKSTDYKVKVNKKDVVVYNTASAPFAAFACNGPVLVEIEMPFAAENVTIAPWKNNIKAHINGRFVTFELPRPMSVTVKVNEMPQFYVYANPINVNPPLATDSLVKYFKAGQVYEVGELTLKDNETLYIEGGAVVRGCIRAAGAKNVRITGDGILDGGYYQKGVNEERSILLKSCENCLIENIILIEPSSWMIVLGNCHNVTVQNIKELGYVSSSDGVDIVGSSKIKIKDCFFRNGDDCIAIKALDMGRYGDFSQNVEDVEVSGCAFVSYRGGHALEIGHELRTPSVRNIRFIDCDILGVHGFGGVFGIHNSDRAVISDILYENIRVEHYYDRLIDLRIIKSRYFKDNERGKAQDIVFKNIAVTVSQANPGYSFSVIGGYDASHIIKNITFDNVTLNGVKVLNGDQLDLFLKQVSNIKFK